MTQRATSDHDAPPTIQPDYPPRRFHWSVRVLIAMASMFLVLAFGVITSLLLPQLDKAVRYSLANVALESLVPLSVSFGGVLLVWLWMRFVDRRPLRLAGLSLNRWTLPMLALGIVVVVGLDWAVLELLRLANLTQPTAVPPMTGNVGVAIYFALLYGFAAQGFPEEVIFRGYLMSTLVPRGPWALSLWSSGTFGILHLLSNGGQTSILERFIYLIQPFGFAFLACALVIVSRNLWVAVGIHGGDHIVTDLLQPYALKIADGPLVWTVIGLAEFALGAAILVWHVRRTGLVSVPDPLYATQ